MAFINIMTFIKNIFASIEFMNDIYKKYNV